MEFKETLNDQALISVIIPTYNRAHLLMRTIHSILDQTYEEFELIIVDDCSTDNTREVVRGFNDTRIKFIRCESNGGAAAARNIGIHASKGKYVAFQDSDDEWLPGKLEKQMKALENAPTEVGGVYTGNWKMEGDNRIYRPPKWMKKEGYLHESMLKGQSNINVQTVVLKKECFNKAGMFDEELSNAEDVELFYRISKHYHFIFLEEPLVIVHETRGSLMTKPNGVMKSSDILLQKYENIRTNRELLAAHYQAVGDQLCTGGHLKEGRKYLINAYRACPLIITPLIAAIISLLGQNNYKKAHALFSNIRGRVYRQ